MKNNVVSIKDFGVECNDELQTSKIQAAIDHCFLQGGGEVVVPAGEYVVAGIRLRSNVTLRLQKGAYLLGSRNARDYDVKVDNIEPYQEKDRTTAVWTPSEGYENVSNGTENMVKEGKVEKGDDDGYEILRRCLSTWNNGVIRALDAYDIAIICEEGAYIDGRDCFDETGEEHYRGPHAISMHRCENIKMQGVAVKNSANWAFALFDSKNITIERVLVEAGHDGVHMTTCDNITITHSEFYCGDDCISGIDNVNVLVKDCMLNTACSAMRFGGTNALVENCTVKGPAKFLFRGSLSDEEKRSGVSPKNEHRHNMLSFFTYYSDFSKEIRYMPSNIKVRNCTVENADRFLHYNFSGNEPWQRNKPLLDIEFEGITAKNIKHPITAYGDEACPVSVSIKGCDLHFSDEREALPFMYLCSANQVLLQDTIVRNFKGKLLVKRWNDMGTIVFDNFVCEGFEGEEYIITEEPFVCNAI